MNGPFESFDEVVFQEDVNLVDWLLEKRTVVLLGVLEANLVESGIAPGGDLRV
jgi:hypothetical protein